MKYSVALIILLLFSIIQARAQKIDSIYFHLYTDSLKKGVYNYINVDGLLSNGRYLPLDTSQVQFSSSDGKWIGNNLTFQPSFDKKSVTVTARLKSNPTLQKTITIYLKQNPDNEHLKTEQEIMNDIKNSNRRKKKG